MRIPSLLVILCLSLALVAACQQLPYPFKGTTEGQEAARALVQEARSVDVEQVEGPAVPMSRLLAQSVADALVDRDIAATAKSLGTSYYVLRSKARTSRDRGSQIIVYIDWTLMDRRGSVIGTHTHGVEGSWWEWVNGEPKILRRVGLDTSKAVAAMLRGSAVAAECSVAQSLWVQKVTGASGDGNTSLTNAIKAALKASDVPLSETPDQAIAFLQGTVKVGPGNKHGQQVVRIDWRVTRPDGSKLLGEANQENAIPTGSLDGPWGRVAGQVAAAAVDGIKQVLAMTGAAAPPSRPCAAAKPANAPPRSAVRGNYRVQLASLRSPERAERAWKRLQKKHPKILSPLRLTIQKADLGLERGVFYRLQVGPFADKAAARAACSTFKQAGMSCLTVKVR